MEESDYNPENSFLVIQGNKTQRADEDGKMGQIFLS